MFYGFERRKEITQKCALELFHAFDNQIPAEWRAREIERWGNNIPGYDLTQIENYLDTVIERLDEKYSAFAK